MSDSPHDSEPGRVPSGDDPVIEGNVDDMAEESYEIPPFEPPADYAFEPELVGAAPRPIPDRIHEGSWARKQRLTVQWLAFAGGLSGLLSTIPQVRAAGVYFLPLLYLDWIAIALLAIAAVAWLWNRFGNTPMRYIERGTPHVGRVLGLVKQPSQIINGQTTQFNFTALVDFLHPETGEHMTAEIVSSDFSADARHKFDTSFRVGDYVTLVYYPEDVESSLRLYGFLDLAPDLGLIRVGKPTTFLELAAATVIVTAILGLLIWNVYALECFEPLEYAWTDFWLPMVIGAVVFGVGFVGYFVHQYRKELREQNQRNLEAFHAGRAVEIGHSAFFAQTGFINRCIQLLVVVALPFMGGLIGVVLGFSANGLGDDGPPTTRPVKILELYEESHAYIVRQYYAEYNIKDDPDGPQNKRKLYTSPEHLLMLAGDGPFEAIIRPGRFGFPWVETLQPVGDPATSPGPSALETGSP